MNKIEAIEECNRYLNRLKEQRERAVYVQGLAKMAREGNPKEAQAALRKLDNERRDVTVYDAAKLEKAIIKLLELVSD